MKKSFLLAIGMLLLLGTGSAFGDITPVSYKFTPSPSNLGDLEHSTAYYWNIDSSSQIVDGLSMYDRLFAGQNILSATLTFTNITDWTNDASNKIFINLFNQAIGTNSVKTFTDTQTDEADYFDSNQYAAYTGTRMLNGVTQYKVGSTWVTTLPLVFTTVEHVNLNSSGDLILENLTTTAQTLSYVFNTSNSNELAKLKEYALDKKDFALAFDPDCHYSNDGITLAVTFDSSMTTQNAVPEPATMMLFGTGLVGLAGITRKRLLKTK